MKNFNKNIILITLACIALMGMHADVYAMGRKRKADEQYAMKLSKKAVIQGQYGCQHHGCGKIYFSQNDAENCEREHLKTRVQCPKRGCGQYFANRNEWLIHYKTHSKKSTPEQPNLKCPCSRTFARLDFFEKHIVWCKATPALQQHAVHTQADEKQFLCCSRLFSEKGLAAHTGKMHPPIPPYSQLDASPSAYVPQRQVQPALLPAITPMLVGAIALPQVMHQEQNYNPYHYAQQNYPAPLPPQPQEPSSFLNENYPWQEDDNSAPQPPANNARYQEPLLDEQDNDTPQSPAHDATTLDCSPDEFWNLQ